MSYVTVEVDVDISEFDDDVLVAEVKRRGLFKRPSADIDLNAIAEGRGAAFIRTGIHEEFSVVVGGERRYQSKGRATVIILEGE